METYIVYSVEGYEQYIPDKDMYLNVRKIQVIATSEDEALAKAKVQHPSKPNFRVTGSVEYAKNHVMA